MLLNPKFDEGLVDLMLFNMKFNGCRSDSPLISNWTIREGLMQVCLRYEYPSTSDDGLSVKKIGYDFMKASFPLRARKHRKRDIYSDIPR